MKYFTPKLYQRFNNEDMSKNSCDEWDIRLKQYWNRVEAIKDRVPNSVQKLMETSLHDSKVLDHDLGKSNVIIKLKKENGELLTLNYTGMAYVETYDGTPFTVEKHPDWLYDEFDLVFGDLEHRIMWSDGKVLRIIFTDLQVS